MAFEQDRHSLRLVETIVPGVFDAWLFTCTQHTPALEGTWQSIGVVIVDEVTPLQSAGSFAHTGTVSGSDGNYSTDVSVVLNAFTAKAVPHVGEPFYFSGLLAESVVEIDTVESTCNPVLFGLPMVIHPELPLARAAAAAMAANASSFEVEGGDPGTGVNQGCFDSAQSEADCIACWDACHRDAYRRRKTCRTDCTYWNWGAIAVGVVVGGTAAACGTALVGAPIGIIIGGIGAGILARAECLSRCDAVYRSEGENCDDALHMCILAH